ncbi:MAG: hypothetical protein PHP51_06075 [Desulfotomaculaceae bacterium]|nr:hypothetical protein [Desulfotomaculaceae bacterium]MDD4767487.1 hypothetical protein [Desulfotomaculaceae bacterium]
MKTITVYRPVKKKKVKSLFLVALLLLMSFLAGAVTEKSVHFLQDVIEAAPIALNELKSFFREKIIFKVGAIVAQAKWSAAIIVSIIMQEGTHVIRGP